MMKKLAKAMLLAAATAFLLANFPACSSDDDDPTLNQIKIRVDESRVKTTYTVGEKFDRTGIMVAATYNDGGTKDVTDDTDFKMTYNNDVFTTETAGMYKGVILTATYGGKTDSVTCDIEVKASDTTGGNEGENQGGGNGGGNEGENQGGGTTYTLDITAIPETTGATTKVDDTVTVVSTIKNSSGKDQTIKYSSANDYVQMSGAKAQAGYGLQLTLPKAAVITATATEKNATTSDTKLVLLDASDASKKAETTYTIYEYGTSASSLKELTLEADAGTYLFGASANGCFVYSLKIEYK